MPFCRSAGRSAGRSALLLVFACLTVFYLSAGLCAALLASLPLCWRAACALVYRATAASLLFVCLCLVFCCWWSHCRLLLIFAASIFSLACLCCPAFSSVVHVDILMFAVVHLFIHCLISSSIHTHFFPILIGFGNVPAFVALCSVVRDICAITSVSCVVRHCAGCASAGCVVACRAAAVFRLSDFLIGFSPLPFAASSYTLMMLSIFCALCLCRPACLSVLGILHLLSFRKVSFFRLLLFS